MPVPIPNTEAKLPCADDTAHGGKVGSGRLLSYTCFHAPPEGASFFSHAVSCMEIPCRTEMASLNCCSCYLSFFMSSSISFSVSFGGNRSVASFGRIAIEKIMIPMHLKMSADKK